MRIVDEKLLDEFRTPGKCEWCGKWCSRREPHHILCKGMGGGGRLDVRINLIALGSSLPFPLCPCHDDAQHGRISREDVLAVVAAREGMLQDQILAELYRLRRAPKGQGEQRCQGKSTRGPGASVSRKPRWKRAWPKRKLRWKPRDKS